MSADENKKRLIEAAELIAKGTLGEVRAVWNTSDSFLAARDRVLPGAPNKPAATYLHLLDALVGVGASKPDFSLFDSALLSLCLAVRVGLDGVPDDELTTALSTLFSAPLGKSSAGQ